MATRFNNVFVFQAGDDALKVSEFIDGPEGHEQSHGLSVSASNGHGVTSFHFSNAAEAEAVLRRAADAVAEWSESCT